jgi:DNA-binding transcriptional ArsR family regulator
VTVRQSAAADVFRAISDPTRRAILDLLRERERSVRELRAPFDMSQPAISQHLGVLRRAGLVRCRRAGKGSLYHADHKPLKQVYEWVARHVEVTDPFGHVWRLTGRKPERKKGT